MSKIVICVPVFDTEANGRTEYTKATFFSLREFVNPDTTTVVFINNNSCKATYDFLEENCDCNGFELIHNDNNVGTAEAINIGIYELADADDYVIKMDNDCIMFEHEWADKMRACMESDPSIGVLGLKRKDLPNYPDSGQYPTKLQFTSTELGEPWHIIELCDDIIGTCHMYSPKLREKVGYLYQPGSYGFDDNLMCRRSILAGFRNAFYPSVEIDHIDTGETEYTDWKRKYASAQWDLFEKALASYDEDISNIYYNPFV
jgi:GT2 family glycosyltransferase